MWDGYKMMKKIILVLFMLFVMGYADTDTSWVDINRNGVVKACYYHTTNSLTVFLDSGDSVTHLHVKYGIFRKFKFKEIDYGYIKSRYIIKK